MKARELLYLNASIWGLSILGLILIALGVFGEEWNVFIIGAGVQALSLVMNQKVLIPIMAREQNETIDDLYKKMREEEK